MAIKSFRDADTEAVAHGVKSKRTLKLLPASLHYPAYKKLVFLDNILSLDSLRAWPGLRLEKLVGDRRGMFSIRINERYRICFGFKDGNAYDVQIVDYH